MDSKNSDLIYLFDFLKNNNDFKKHRLEKEL